MADRPLLRNEAESSDDHLARYPKSSDFGEQAVWELGVKVKYLDNGGARIDFVRDGSPAAGILKLGDIVLEVDGFPVGIQGKRNYVIWSRYSFGNNGLVQLTVIFWKNGEWRYFYPKIQLSPIIAGYEEYSA